MTTYSPNDQCSNPRKDGKSVLMSKLYDLWPYRSALWHKQHRFTFHFVHLSHYHILYEMKMVSNPRPLAWKASTCHLDYQVYFQGSFTSLEITVRFCGKKYWEDWRFSKRRCWRRVRSSSPSTDFSSWIAWPCRQTQTQATETSAVTSRHSVTVPEDVRLTLWRRNYFF